MIRVPNSFLKKNLAYNKLLV